MTWCHLWGHFQPDCLSLLLPSWFTDLIDGLQNSMAEYYSLNIKGKTVLNDISLTSNGEAECWYENLAKSVIHIFSRYWTLSNGQSLAKRNLTFILSTTCWLPPFLPRTLSICSSTGISSTTISSCSPSSSLCLYIIISFKSWAPCKPGNLP